MQKNIRIIALAIAAIALTVRAQEIKKSEADWSGLADKEFAETSTRELRAKTITPAVVGAEAIRRLSKTDLIASGEFALIEQFGRWAAPHIDASVKLSAKSRLLARLSNVAQLDAKSLRSAHAAAASLGATVQETDILLTTWHDAHKMSDVAVTDLEWLTARLSETPLSANKLRIEWNGSLRPAKQGLYKFSTTRLIADDDSPNGRIRSHLRVWIGGALTLDTDTAGWLEVSQGVLLDNSRSESIKVEFTHERPEKSPVGSLSHPAIAMLYWEGPGINRQIVPSEALRQPAEGPPGLAGKYECSFVDPLSGQEKAVATTTRTDPQIDFAWWSAEMNAFRPHQDRLKALADHLSVRYLDPEYLSQRVQTIAGKQRQAVDNWTHASALFTSAQRQAVCKALQSNAALLAKIGGTHMRRIHEIFRAGAEEESLDLWGTWFNAVPDFEPVIAKDLPAARTDLNYLGMYLWQIYPAGLTRMRDRFVRREDGSYCLNVAYAVGYAYAATGDGETWVRWLEKQVDLKLSGDRMANWLLIRSNAEQIRSFENPRRAAYRPTEKPLDGLSFLNDALQAAESETVRLKIYKEQLARFAAGGDANQVRALLDGATTKFASAEGQKAISAWRKDLDTVLPGQPAIASKQELKPEYIDCVRRRLALAPQFNDPAALEIYRQLAKKLGVPSDKSAAPPPQANGSERLERDSKVLTNADYHPLANAFHRRVLLEAYREHGERDDRWNLECEALLLECSYRLATVPWRAEHNDLSTLADAALLAGCQDPLVLCAVDFVVSQHLFKVEQASAITKRLSDRKEAPFLVAYAASQWAKLAAQEKQQEGVEAALQIVGEQLVRSLDGSHLKPSEERTAYRAWCEVLAECTQTTAKLDDLVEQAEKNANHPWLAQLLAAKHYHEKGWRARGTGYAGQVTEEGWKGFRENLAKQKSCLLEAYRLKPEWPEAASEMIGLAANQAAEEGETVEIWFRRAIAAQPDFEAAYLSMRNFALPRWGGSHEQMIELGRLGFETKRFDTLAPLMYLESVCAVANEDVSYDTAYYRKGGKELYAKLQPVFAGYENTEVLKWRHNFIRSLHALLAYNCGEYSAARGQLEKLNADLDPKALERVRAIPRTVWMESYAFGGPAAKEFQEVRKRIDAKEWEAAEQLLNDATQKTELDKHSQEYARDLAAAIVFQKQFDSGEWVDLKFDAELTGWETIRGKFRRQNDSALVGRASSGDLIIRLRSPVGHRFEYRGEVAIPKLKFNTDNGGPLYCMCALPVRRIRSFLIFPAQNRKEIAVRRDVIFGEPTPADVRVDKNVFQVSVWDRSQTVRLNGKVVHDREWLEAENAFGEDESIGLGACFRYDGPDVTFRNLQVRKLVSPP